MIAVDTSSWVAFFSDRDPPGDGTCLDHGVRLITRDDDFRHFARVGGLRLAV
ncbi:MAG: hypothetical protein ACQGVC_23715 [Myxococcota bacterium]